MKRFMTVMLLLVIVSSPIGLQAWYYLPLAPETAVSPILRRRLLDATVRIVMFAPARTRDGNTIKMEGGVLQYTSTGLGTLVVHDGTTWIVTHDHWALPFESLSHVTFSTADNREILTIPRSEFLRAVRHQDSGTLIMVAPPQLRTKAAVRVNTAPVQLGTRMHAVYYNPLTRAIDVTPVAVDAGLEQDGCRVWQLRSLGRKSMAHGNSGAGVFRNGRLAGNIWLTTRYEFAVPYGERRWAHRLDTFLSTAAELPHETLTIASAPQRH